MFKDSFLHGRQTSLQDALTVTKIGIRAKPKMSVPYIYYIIKPIKLMIRKQGMRNQIIMSL